ncbi:MAG: hypothetical protein EHM20_06915 [Alphaproteobacteria bacterium]|nr:MAG: hypothetical protein EHM20_06915 [Alphaproteobacteria bacterium]
MFSCKLIPNIEKYRNTEYFVEIKNREWFADAKNVECYIEIAARAMDFEDLEIYNAFKDTKEGKYVPVMIKGKWISENENKVEIKAGKRKRFRFIKTDAINNDLIVFGNSITDGTASDVLLPPNKKYFFVSARGQIKGGSFSTRFQVIATYKGKNELVNVEIVGNDNICIDIEDMKEDSRFPLFVSNR